MHNQDLPNNYFDRLSGKIFERVQHLEDNLELEAPILFDQNKLNIYCIPNNYFEGNEKRLLESLDQKNKKFRIGYRIASIAASFIILISASWFGFSLLNQGESQIIIEESNYISYLIKNNEELETDIILTLDDIYLEDNEVDLDDISNEEIQEYLGQNVDDLTINDLIILEI